MKRIQLYFIIFTLSGFSGLIYESIWTHYLKLFLGHAAYAQTLVLAIFMGGMAIGSWICSRFSTRWSSLLKGYAIVEGLVGVAALLFHPLFDALVNHAYLSIIPSLGSPSGVEIFKWSAATLAILPQSVLLGMTFPLMSGALLRLYPGRTGSNLSMLYFTNSIGAVFGVLISGFVLIRALGLPGTIMTAGALNIILALVVWLLARRENEAVPPPETASAGASEKSGQYCFLLLVALATGAASFIYEIVWIRMLSLVLGSSTHSFELMLSAFICGLAFGGLWIKRRIDRLPVPVRTLAVIQLVMGLLALATLPVYNGTFPIMQWLVNALPKTAAGYLLFNISSQSIAFGVMLPAAFCAGMTLPLITSILIRNGHGEKSIGAVYAANTVGAIIGVFAAVHIGLPMLGIKGLLVCGASLDMLFGIVLAGVAACRWKCRDVYMFTGTATAAVLITILFVQLDPVKLSSGVYRHGTLVDRKSRVLFHEDGKTATVSVIQNNTGINIKTNGKTDAEINMSAAVNASADEGTMILLAALPMAIHGNAASVANIGFGSGLTTQTLLTSPRLREVDTIEIEPKMVEAARLFAPRNSLAYTDSRSRIHFDDAKSFFSKTGKRYDIVISEPSNPWVSGVSGLFSREFYSLAKRSLKDDGLFVQWLQLYEIDLPLVSTVMKALTESFPDYMIFASNSSDIVIIARKNGRITSLPIGMTKEPTLHDPLKRIDIKTGNDVGLRFIGNRIMLAPLFGLSPFPANSDYFPVLDQNAARTRFLKVNTEELMQIASDPLPAREMLSGVQFVAGKTELTPSSIYTTSVKAYIATGLRDFLLTGNPPSNSFLTSDTLDEARLFRGLFTGDVRPDNPDAMRALFTIGTQMIATLTKSELDEIWSRLGTKGVERWPGEFVLYLDFLKSVGKRDAAAMTRSANNAIRAYRTPPPPVFRHLVAGGLLGYVAEGRFKDAAEWWKSHGPRYIEQGEPGILVRMLLAIMSGETG
jgi:predicted membrane-bound spermidine synthase